MLGIGLALIACATGTDQPTVAQIAFSCRLPVLDGRSGTWQGGFVTFPAALLSIDPNGAFTEEPSTHFQVTRAEPRLFGSAAWPSYAGRAQRWVPAEPDLISPDGMRYAYRDPGPAGAGLPVPSLVRVVEIGSATYKVFPVPQPGGEFGGIYVPTPIGWLDDGSLAVMETPGQGPFGPSVNQSVGLFRVDIASGGVVKVGTVKGIPEGWGGGAAWISVVNPHDAHAVRSGFEGIALPDEIDRVDLTGNVTSWYYAPGKIVRLGGFDTLGHPFVVVTNPDDANHHSVRLVPTANSTAAKPQWTYDFQPVRILADSHGVWFYAQFSGFSLGLVTDSGLHSVRVHTASKPDENITVIPAGPCA